MRIERLALLILVISACCNFSTHAYQKDMYEVITDAIKEKIQEFMDNSTPELQNQMQLQFIQSFIKGIIMSEIKLYDWVVNDKDLQNNQQLKNIESEVNMMIELLFNGKYKSLQEFINAVKKEDPETLEGIFSEETFKDDIQNFEKQQKLVNIIVEKLLQDKSLPDSIQDLQQLKKFFVQYKGMTGAEFDQVIEYLKDANKIKKSLEKFVKKIEDPTFRNKLTVLAYKIANLKKNQSFFDIIYEEPVLIEALMDQDWGTLLKMKDYITLIGGKAYEEYQRRRDEQIKKEEEENENDDDEDEEDDDEQSSSSSSLTFGKVVLIIASIAFVIGLVFIGVRKYRQNKFANESFSDNRNFYQQQL